MKSLKLCLIFLVCFLVGFGTEIRAEGFIAKEIRLITQRDVYEAGTTQEIGIIQSNTALRINSEYEYGVAREIQNGFITSFEILTTETIRARDQIKLSIKIPNTLKTNATSTYVAYVKSFVKNEPESENFFVTKSFKITSNDKPYVEIKNINLLQSNGERFALTDGPTIYDALQGSSTLSTSTSIEVTFESNTETILQPSIAFSKIRSSIGNLEHTPNDILIKKGINYFTIPLPTFSYEPGVYIGKLQFRNSLISNQVNFQYIIAGESASVGLVTPTPEGRFIFEVFGTPIDVYGSSTVATTTEIHTVKTVFKLGNAEIFSTSTVVDFASSTFDIHLPATIKNIDSVYVEVISNRTGKILYSGDKSVSFSVLNKKNTLYVYYILFLFLLMTFAYKRQAQKFLIVLVLFAMFIFGQRAFAAVWNPSGNSPSYLINAGGVYYSTEKYTSYLHIYFNENIAQKTYTCSQALTFMFKVEFTYCANSIIGVKVGFATTSSAAADAAAQVIAANNDGQAFESTQYMANFGSHYFYRNITQFKQFTGPILGSNTNKLYVTLQSAYINNTNLVTPGYTRYAIPLTVGACTACSNAPSTSNVPNFQLHGRKYYFSTSTQKLYYRDANDLNMAPASCGIDLCADTVDIEEIFPPELGWNPSPGTYSKEPSRYSCVPIVVNCACSGRNRVCTNQNTSTSSTESNHSTCLLKGFCSTTYQNKNSGTMRFDATNKLGDITFSPGAQSEIYVQDIPPDGYSVVKKIFDSFDDRSTDVSCTLDYKGGIEVNSGGAGILRFYASPSVVHEGADCRFGWETNNMQSCVIDNRQVPVDAEPGDLTSFQASSTKTNQNVVKKLTCLSKPSGNSGLTQQFSTTTTCYVNPRLREN